MPVFKYWYDVEYSQIEIVTKFLDDACAAQDFGEVCVRVVKVKIIEAFHVAA